MKTSALRRRPSIVHHWYFLLVYVTHWSFLLVDVDHWSFLLVDFDQTDVFMVDIDQTEVFYWSTSTMKTSVWLNTRHYVPLHWSTSTILMFSTGRRSTSDVNRRRCQHPFLLMFSSRPTRGLFLVSVSLSSKIGSKMRLTLLICQSTDNKQTHIRTTNAID